MKTTIEIHGYQIVIEESEGNISVSALKDDETVEEFTLENEVETEGEEGLHAFGDEEAQEDDFDDAEGAEEGEEDFDDEEGSEEPLEGGEEDFDEEDIEDVEEEGKLESFNSFIKKRK